MTEQKIIDKFFQKTELLAKKEGLDWQKIKKAVIFAQKAHCGQVRKSNDYPYIIHPLEVAYCLLCKYKDLVLTLGAILHDTVEDCEELEIKEVYDQFGSEVGFIVDAADKNTNSFYQFPEIVLKDKVERLLWAGEKDIRCLLLKMADRENNLETLNFLKSGKQVRMAFETQAVFSPLEKILKYKDDLTIKEIKKLYQEYLQENNLHNEKEVKHKLRDAYFEQMSSKMFNLVYTDSSSVVWEVEDLDYYKELVKNKEFAKNVESDSLWTDGDNFKAKFKFKGGVLLNNDHNSNGKLRVATFNC